MLGFRPEVANGDDFEYAFSGVIDPPPLAPFNEEEDDPGTFHEHEEVPKWRIDTKAAEIKREVTHAGLRGGPTRATDVIDDAAIARRARDHW